jgi:uncharacterized phage infection (PIP) family protein YhgE
MNKILLDSSYIQGRKIPKEWYELIKNLDYVNPSNSRTYEFIPICIDNLSKIFSCIDNQTMTEKEIKDGQKHYNKVFEAYDCLKEVPDFQNVIKQIIIVHDYMKTSKNDFEKKNIILAEKCENLRKALTEEKNGHSIVKSELFKSENACKEQQQKLDLFESDQNELLQKCEQIQTKNTEIDDGLNQVKKESQQLKIDKENLGEELSLQTKINKQTERELQELDLIAQRLQEEISKMEEQHCEEINRLKYEGNVKVIKEGDRLDRIEELLQKLVNNKSSDSNELSSDKDN